MTSSEPDQNQSLCLCTGEETAQIITFSQVKSSQVTFICIALYTIQIVSKLYSIKQ